MSFARAKGDNGRCRFAESETLLHSVFLPEAALTASLVNRPSSVSVSSILRLVACVQI